MRQWKSATGKVIQLEEGDITLVEADAIVNAANAHLAGGGGVDGAIHRAAGPEIMTELDAIRARIRHCPPGDAVVTTAGRLRARYIFHAVGPMYRGGGSGEADQLASCYRRCLGLAAEHGLKSIAFPAISTGIYGYPVEEAAEISVREIRGFLDRPSSLELIRVVLFGQKAYETSERALLAQTGARRAPSD